MEQFVLVLVRVGILVLLWSFVLIAVRVVRSDLFASAEQAVPGRQQPVPVSPSRRQVRRGERDRSRSEARRLVVTEGGLTGTSLALGTEPVTLGRADSSTLVLTDDYASSHHAQLVPGEGRWLVEDLGSTNGTYLEGRKVSDPTPVPLGAPIRIGKTVLELRR